MKRNNIYILLSIVLIGSILRLYNLAFNSLWLDEASTYSISSQSLFSIWQYMAAGEFNPPLFYWIEHIMLVFGNSEIILRIVPAIFGILTIPIFYLIGKEFLNDKTGFVLATLAAFSPFLILYSQEARAYSMMLFFVALAFYFYLKNNQWVLFGIASSIAMWVHFYSFIAIATLILIHIAVYRNKDIIKSIAVIGVLCAPLFYFGITLFILRTSVAPSFGINGLNLAVETISEISGFNLAAAFIFSIAGITGLLYLRNRSRSLMLLSSIVGILIISVILSYKMPMVPRYLIILTPFVYLAVTTLLNKIKTSTVVCAGLAILILTSAPFLCSYYTQQTKDDWRGFSGMLGAITNDGDNVIVVPAYIVQPLNYYYNNTTDNTNEILIYSTNDLKDKHGWVVLTGDATQEELALLQNNAQLVRQYGAIYLLKI